MAEPTDPGTQPSIVAPSLDGMQIAAPKFNFDVGLRGLSESGPFGPMPGDVPNWEQSPRLGYAAAPGQLRTLTLTMQTPTPFSWTPYDVNRPCVLMPYRSAILAGTAGILKLHFLPANTGPTTIGDDAGIVAQRCAAYLWAPGRWYLLLRGGSDTLPVDFLEIPAEDRNVAEFLMGRSGVSSTGGMQLESSVAIPAAVATTVVEMSLVLLRDYLRIVNVGANPAKLKFAGSPTATETFSLGVGEFLDFFGPTLPVSRLRAFSTLGTTIEVWSVRRHLVA